MTEDFLLKVTNENRQLQKKLFNEAENDKKQSKSGGSRSESRSQSKRWFSVQLLDLILIELKSHMTC